MRPFFKGCRLQKQLTQTDFVAVEQLFDNAVTPSYLALKMSLSHHKQIKTAGFVDQDRYCLISSDWCIVSYVGTVIELS